MIDLKKPPWSAMGRNELFHHLIATRDALEEAKEALERLIEGGDALDAQAFVLERVRAHLRRLEGSP